jgi:arginyl-tRNA synthetase
MFSQNRRSRIVLSRCKTQVRRRPGHFNEQARREVVRLHNHDKGTMRVWKQIVDESRKHYLPIYEQLNVTLTQSDERGESFYADKLADVVKSLKASGIASESDGAFASFRKGFKNKEGQPLPFIIQKSDGAFLYATTDLAALRFRIQELQADKIIYVTDARQTQHFQMLFAGPKWPAGRMTCRELMHVTFGTMLGDGRQALQDPHRRHRQAQRTARRGR